MNAGGVRRNSHLLTLVAAGTFGACAPSAEVTSDPLALVFGGEWVLERPLTLVEVGLCGALAFDAVVFGLLRLLVWWDARDR